MMPIILLVIATATCRVYYPGAWPRGTLLLLIIVFCLLAPGHLLMTPVLALITEFVQRYHWQTLLLLGLVSTYRLSDTMMGVMAGVSYIGIGLFKEAIVSVSKVFGVFMTLVGVAAGRVLITHLSILSTPSIGGVALTATNLLSVMLAQFGPLHAEVLLSHDVISLAMALEPYALMPMMIITLSNFSGSLVASASAAYLSSLINLKSSVTQYTMFSSTMLLLPRFTGGYPGTMVESLGYECFFHATATMGIPTLLLIGRLWLCRMPSSEMPAPGHQNAEQHRGKNEEGRHSLVFFMDRTGLS